MPDFFEEDKIDFFEEPTTEVDKYLQMPREEFLQLPFAERALASKLIGSEAKRQTSTAFARGAIPGLKRLESLATDLPQTKITTPAQDFMMGLAGETIPIHQMSKLIPFTNPVLRVLGMGGVGATYAGVRKLADEGEMPTPGELLEHGTVWAGLEGATSLLGYGGKLVSAVNRLAKSKGIPRKEALKFLMNQAKEEGVNISKFADFSRGISKGAEYEKEVNKILDIGAKEAEAVKIEEIGIDFFKETAPKEKVPETKKPRPSEAIKPKVAEKPKPKEITKPKQPEDITTREIAEKHLPTKSTVAETAKRAAKEPHELYSPPVFGEAEEKLSLWEKTKKKLPKFMQERTELGKRSWKIREDYYGKRYGLDMRYRQKWNKYLKEKKLSSQDLEDMIFYIEDPKALGKSRNEKGTGNPFVGKDDTWEAVSKRLSPDAKKASKVVNDHFAEMLKTLNESPYVKNISPREFLEDIYVPHFYEGKIKPALNEVMKQKRFSTKNPLANMRKYITFNDALQEAGLVPKYRNINDLLNHYDNLMIRVLSNSELAGQIKELEDSLGQKLIARPNNKKLYQEAKAEGWEEFSDPFLRRRVVGTDKTGKPIFATSEANALVHPDLAESLYGIFTKEAYRPDNIMLQGIDAYNDAVRRWKVSFSPIFHLGALSESLAGAQGLRGFKTMIKDWDKIFSDPAFNEFAASSGLKFGIPTDTAMKDSRVLFDKSLTKMELEAGKKGLVAKGLRKGLQASQKGAQFLFDEIHPRMKMITFNDYLVQAERRAIKKGIPITAEWRKTTGREIASIVNDQFGGQMWELMKIFSNPNNLKWGKRAVSYLDWSTSALRQLTAMVEDIPQIMRGEGQSLRGYFARRYNARYVAYTTLYSQMMSYAYTGLENKKDKAGNPIPNSIRWNYDKAHSTFQNKDPKHRGYLSQFFHYQLPDVVFKVGGVTFNPGRDAKGRRRYAHAGKQFLEVPKYFTNFVGQLYNKSTPFIQAIVPYVMGVKPGEGAWKPRGVWQGGKTMPWDGTEPWTLARQGSRALFLSEQLVPFAGSALVKNPAAFPFVWFGTFPISKGISLTASEDYYKTYYRILYGENYAQKDKDEADKRIQELDEVLLDQKYNMSMINRKKTSARKYVQKKLSS